MHHGGLVTKLIPALGALVLLGVIVQIILGFQIAGGLDYLTGAHILIGLAGLVLVIALAAVAFRAKTATKVSKIILTILTLVVILQVYVGLQLLGGGEMMATSHMANAFLILILAAVAGGVTMLSARKHSTP